jgi:hypothetical protein
MEDQNLAEAFFIVGLGVERLKCELYTELFLHDPKEMQPEVIADIPPNKDENFI